MPLSPEPKPPKYSPLCIIITWRERLSPIPYPFGLVVKKGTKIFSCVSGAIPAPLCLNPNRAFTIHLLSRKLDDGMSCSYKCIFGIIDQVDKYGGMVLCFKVILLVS